MGARSHLKLALWAALLGGVLIVLAVLQSWQRVAERESLRAHEMRNGALSIGFVAGRRLDEQFFWSLLSRTGLGATAKDTRVSHCFRGTRHGVDAYVCDLGNPSSGEMVAAFRLPNAQVSNALAERRGWTVERSGEWLVLYRAGERDLGDLAAFVARAEALARPEVFQLSELPPTPGFRPSPPPKMSEVREAERRWSAFTRMKEWRAFFGRLAELEGLETSEATRVHAYACDPVADDVAEPTPTGRNLASSQFPYVALNRPGDVGTLLSLLRRTVAGRAAVDEFYERYRRGEIKVKQFTNTLQAQLAGHPAALFVFRPDSGTRTIYVDFSRPLGLMAPVFFHEMTRSLDESAIEARKLQQKLMTELATRGTKVIQAMLRDRHRPLSLLQAEDFDLEKIRPFVALKRTIDEMADIATYQTERRAADAEYLVAQELVRRFPQYYENMTQDGRRYHYVPHRRIGMEVIDHYALRRSTIERYLKGECESLGPPG